MNKVSVRKSWKTLHAYLHTFSPSSSSALPRLTSLLRIITAIFFVLVTICSQ